MGAVEHPFAFLKKRADVKSCCGDPKNLIVTHPTPGASLAICTVCTRKHRKLVCDPNSPMAAAFRAVAK